MKWWRIYYSDSVFTSDDGEPHEAPRQDVQVIVQDKEETGYEIVHGKDYFYWEPKVGGWHSTDIYGAFDHLVRSEKQVLLFGRMLSDPDWRALFKRVKEDIGPRNAVLNRENRREPRL